MKNLNFGSFFNNRVLLGLLVVFTMTFIAISCSDDQEPVAGPAAGSADKGKTGIFDPPVISCVDATQTSLTVTITAASTKGGAPAGFSLQWITRESLDANGGIWPSDESLFCKASFSGNAYGHNFNLDPGESTTVTIGDILFDTPGASSSCVADLLCGTQYVFRAFAHATSTMFKSAWSVQQTCTTDECVDNCVFGQGHWKNNPDLWPVEELSLGDVSYNKTELLSILNTPPAGNGLISLAHQLIAAKLNIANGADGTSIAQTIADADDLIGALVVPPVGGGSLAPAATGALVTVLDEYNKADEGVSYCQ